MEKERSPVLFHSGESLYGELSNFYPLRVPLVFEDETYATSEHLYQSLKFLCFRRTPEKTAFADLIRRQNTPNKAKTLAAQRPGGKWLWQRGLGILGQRYKNKGAVMDPRWDSVREAVMQDVLDLKFRTNPNCMDVLMCTGSRELREHTKTDKFWGDGGDGSGANRLGIILMRLRERYRIGLLPPPTIRTYLKEDNEPETKRIKLDE